MVCRLNLNAEMTQIVCFLATQRAGRRTFGAKCSKCCRGISSSDWVRKAREQIYHLACFACDACGRQLSTGEQFALHEDRVLCKPHYLETLDGGSISSDDGCDSEGYHKSKAKRVRTTFTEEQLQVLQANFQLDSNPDGQDLERIAQVTGLSKRVTQVWFQNSRARQKKHQHTGKGKQNQLMSRDADPAGFGRPINLHLTYSFQNKPPFVPIDGTSFTDSSMDELSEDSSIHCMQSEV
ncbi:LIM/homeobox protein Awh [Papilio xuthus]|uniref:LIM/homeobox protein Awh n=1 Tax=Papilio xuthus TaxID=66420 RepID=A0A194PNJ5_PAPXU|nr:LIM/homeobox protein Awh [Papilio xuthus]